ncbi:unnamed protein product [Rodentolepis nana]|uniref:Sal-like protein 3 n=1 Tax=Rodentolepis nana TaxID=102285 RepID=A0A0R3TKQ1_RODNA|nr:unnamed protein product [Rodentolepis nana]
MDCNDEVVDMRKRSIYEHDSDPSFKKRIKSSINSVSENNEEDTLDNRAPESKPSLSPGEPLGGETDFSEGDENEDYTVCEVGGGEGDENQYFSAALNPMDPALRELIRKYIRADYVINCLELAGFDNAVVFSCLNNETNIRRLENFVGTTCGLITSHKIRQHFLGPLYARHPSNFKLPAGVVCGLRLAVEELKRSNGFLTLPSTSYNVISDVATQTDCSNPGVSSMASSSEGSPPDPAFANGGVDSSLIPPPAHISSTDNLSFANHPSLPNPSSSFDGDCKRLLDCMNGGRFPLPTQSQSTSPQSRYSFSDNIDVERLIHHSSASACRLAARQFVNANLVRGQHFDMEMEVTGGGENGQKRVTGIFYCHLCREKRERTCAVRFSVARNRYPVMSNVLSHLKTHFQYQSSVSASSNGGSSGGLKKLPPPSVSPNALMENPSPNPSLLPPAGPPPPFLSPNSFCNLVSRVVQIAASANQLSPGDMTLASQVPLVSPPPPSLPSKLSPVN